MSAFMLALLQNQQPRIYGTGEKRRDFIYVDDVNDFHLQCLRDPRTIGQTFNLGYGVPYSVNEIYARIAALIGSDIRPEYVPDLAGEAQTTHADIRKAQALGWTPKIDLDEGLTRSLRYLREHVIANRDPAPAERSGVT
jgi:UDP-glucose 4-epimerase